MALVVANAIINAFNPIFSYNPDKNLMFLSYTTCDTHEPSCFWTFWFCQVIGYSISSMTHVACDCILLNIIQRICTNFRILQHRLMILPDLVSEGVLNTAEEERRYLIECILDHQNIYS